MPTLQRKHTEKNTPSTEPPVKEPELTLEEILSTPWLRLTHLYYVKDKNGTRRKFTPWPEQAEMFWNMHYLNIVLKARQRGITTMIQLFMLDACLFNDGVSAGVIAHTREDAQKFFNDKIKFAYDNLPEALKQEIPAKNDNTNELSFSNGSSIRVGTSMRSGTLQYLHISEYGRLCAKYPEKAQEIRSGSLNTVAPGNFVFIESTAEGAHGDFYHKCVSAEQIALGDKPLTDMDYKFFFFPWWRAKEYRMDTDVSMTMENEEYFEGLHRDHDIVLRQEQKNWYVKKRQEQGDVTMTQEYPSTSAEAFRGIIDGAVYAKQVNDIRKEKRLRNVAYIPTTPVNTFWDIGRDMTSIWFHQRVGPENRFIDYHQEPNQSLPYFARLLLQDRNNRFHKYLYGTHYFPHDMGQIEYTQSEQLTRKQVAHELGLSPARVVERIKSLDEGIELSRQAMASCYFDKTQCEEGIKALENYRYEWDDKNEIYKPKPVHNWASHGADAFRQFAQGYRYRPDSTAEDSNPMSRAYRRRTKNSNTDWRI